MANQKHVNLLLAGSEPWKQWRESDPDTIPDLRGADLRSANLSFRDLRGADMSTASLNEANLYAADLSGADLTGADLSRTNLQEATLENTIFVNAVLNDASLLGVDLRTAKLDGAIFDGAFMLGAKLNRLSLTDARVPQFTGTNLSNAAFEFVELPGVDLTNANLTVANLFGAKLAGANCSCANFTGATLSGADLRGAQLNNANFTDADLTGADLRGATLRGAVLVNTMLGAAKLEGCSVFGLSAWNLTLDEKTNQKNLRITPDNEPAITVDNLEVAQFIYLLLNNRKIRDVIDTVTSKVVLILGRFTEERKQVLDKLREELRRRNYSPVLFDFDKPAGLDLTETITLLARMARFIVADLTDPASIPQELQAIVPHVAVPVQPLLEGNRPYSMFKDYKKFHWVLKLHRYDGLEGLLASIEEKVIAPAESKAKELLEKKNEPPE